MAEAKWSIDIGAWCEKAQLDLDRACRAIVLQLFSNVVERTPVWSGGGHAGGTARGNWQLGLDVMPAGTTTVLVGRGGGKAHVAGQLPTKVVGHVVWFVNHLPYIGELEYGGFPNPPKAGTGRTIGGYSTQAPAGMVRVSVEELSGRINDAIKGAGL